MRFGNYLLMAFVLLSFAVFMSSCEEDSNTPDGNKTNGIELIGLDKDESGGTTNYYLSKISFNGEEGTVKHLVTTGSNYKYHFFTSKIDGERLYMYDILPEYPNKLVAMDMQTMIVDTFPAAGTDRENTWAVHSSGFDVQNGYCYYIMREISKNYADWAGSYLCRYNLSTGDFVQMSNPVNFILNQPEKGWDTETGHWSSVFASADGMTAYGSIMAWGVDGGSNHYDYDVIYRYEPDNTAEPLTRIGDVDMGISGATKGCKYLYKSSNVVTTATGEMREMTNATYIPDGYTGTKNEKGAIKISNSYGYDIYVLYYDLEKDERRTVVETGSHEVAWCQLAKDGNSIIFGIYSDEENILCQTHNLEAGSAWDTLGTYPKSVRGCMLR
jgi:hypothetical protein